MNPPTMEDWVQAVQAGSTLLGWHDWSNQQEQILRLHEWAEARRRGDDFVDEQDREDFF